MTKEHRIIFELSDLKAFRFTCRNCKGGFVFKVSCEKNNLPLECSYCGKSLESIPVSRFVSAIRKLIDHDKDVPLSVKVKLEMDDC